MENCIFCKIVAGKAPCHKIWEDDEHLAFLSIEPNTPGVTVVITKAHQQSDAFKLPDDVLARLTIAAKRVAHLLEKNLEDVGRVGLVYEGYGVNHIHAKLFPMHGTKGEWKEIHSEIEHTFDTYPGYISSHSAKRAPDDELARIAKRIRGE